MSRQYFADLVVEPLYGANTIVSSTGAAIVATTETLLFPPSQIAVAAADFRPGRVWKLTAGGIYTIGATGTLTITPYFGQSATIGTNVTLGASNAQTALVYNVTAKPWYMEYIVQCMSESWQTGAHGSVIGTGVFHGTGIAGTGGSQNTIVFGGTAGTVDPTNSGLTVTWTLSVAGSISPQWQILQSLN